MTKFKPGDKIEITIHEHPQYPKGIYTVVRCMPSKDDPGYEPLVEVKELRYRFFAWRAELVKDSEYDELFI